jgi:redox-sensing transcriptional repressor
MGSMGSNAIPDIIVGRMPIYLQMLQRMYKQNQITTSSQELGNKLGISPAQIRKDLSQFGEFGKQGTGYNIAYLIAQIQTILHVDQVWDIVLVGAGDLGHAIAHYQGFTNRGYRIAFVVDNDPVKIGTTIADFTVQDSSKLKELLKPTGIKIAMLTVPASNAQAVAELLVESGIEAILNYAPITLNLPAGIQVEYIDPILQLQHMTYYVGQ